MKFSGVVALLAAGTRARAADGARTPKRGVTASLNPGGVVPLQVAGGGRPAEILFFGNAPGFPGCHQVNFRVPSGFPRGQRFPCF